MYDVENIDFCSDVNNGFSDIYYSRFFFIIFYVYVLYDIIYIFFIIETVAYELVPFHLYGIPTNK